MPRVIGSGGKMTRLNLRNPCGGSSVRGVQIRHSYLLDKNMSQALCLVSVEFSGVGPAGGQAFSATVIDAQACRSCTCNDVPWSDASCCVHTYMWHMHFNSPCSVFLQDRFVTPMLSIYNGTCPHNCSNDRRSGFKDPFAVPMTELDKNQTQGT